MCFVLWVIELVFGKGTLNSNTQTISTIIVFITLIIFLINYFI